MQLIGVGEDSKNIAIINGGKAQPMNAIDKAEASTAMFSQAPENKKIEAGLGHSAPQPCPAVQDYQD